METKEKKKILKNFKLFQSLSDKDVLYLASSVREVNFGPRDTLINEGEFGTDIFLVYEGSVRIYRLSEDGREVNLSVKGRGDIVGEMAIFDHGIRTAFVEALENTKTLKITKNEFEKFFISSPEAALELLRILSKRLYENGQLIQNLETKSLKERVKSTLLALKTYMPKINLTQEQLSSLVGATRPRVSEIIAELKEESFLKIDKHELVVLQGTE